MFDFTCMGSKVTCGNMEAKHRVITYLRIGVTNQQEALNKPGQGDGMSQKSVDTSNSDIMED